MAKRRFQSPEPERLGNWWYLRYWADVFENGKLLRKRIRHKLAPASKGEREVKKMAAEFLRPMNQGLESIGSATLFTDYVQSTYSSTLLPLMAKSTRDRYEGIIRNYLTPAFGGSPKGSPMSTKQERIGRAARKTKAVLAIILASW